jgi:uncharacterized phage-associated protein
MYKALEVANYIIKSDKVNGLTPLKLQKLLYFVYGIYWTQKKERLFSENFLAWKYGPVLRSVYDSFKHFGSKALRPSVAGNSSINDSDKVFIDGIIEAFANTSASERVTLTHLTEPWDTAYKNLISDEIKPDSIHVYFDSLAT